MDYPNNTTNSRKQKHLNFEERVTIQLRLKDGYTPYRIAKELGRSINTITNEIKRGTVAQIIQNKKVMVYLADTGESIYNRNRMNCCPKFKRFTCSSFVTHVCNEMRLKEWSVDASVGSTVKSGKFKLSETVCTKTIYNYIDLGLVDIANTDLPLKLRRNNKPKRVRHHKRNLGRSIEERPESVDSRHEFGHWEIDTVIGLKAKTDNVLLTITERQTRNSIVRIIPSKTASAVREELNKIKDYFGSKFSQIFRTITGDNGLEFAELSTLEKDTDTKVYFAHPYSPHERGTNERHNGLIRKFIPKGVAISKFSIDAIAFIEDWCNQLPRKILGYKTPEELFEEQLDIIYSC
ncbi:IS30 family transposase [Haloimpatiens massiliensis]|uniref:IS30 family transposase n=1 Tax=Haloimpatiens massiliensis TaxID=1658110 RepID=UPI000C82BBFE|nr:IS30 family transposase [Haloimpatiens massiliensis]